MMTVVSDCEISRRVEVWSDQGPGGSCMAVQAEASEPLLTPAQVARILYVDPKTVTRWAKAGKIDSVLTPGGQRRFLESDVLAVLSGVRFRPPAVVLSSAVVSGAIDLALDAEAEAAAAVEALLASVESLSAAAEVAAKAALRARAARALDAAEAAKSVAGDAALCAAAIRSQAEVTATRVIQTAALAASIIISAGDSGDEDETSAAAARNVAATLKSAADAMTLQANRAAASVASAVASAAALMTSSARDAESTSVSSGPALPRVAMVPAPRGSSSMSTELVGTAAGRLN